MTSVLFSTQRVCVVMLLTGPTWWPRQSHRVGWGCACLPPTPAAVTARPPQQRDLSFQCWPDVSLITLFIHTISFLGRCDLDKFSTTPTHPGPRQNSLWCHAFLQQLSASPHLSRKLSHKLLDHKGIGSVLIYRGLIGTGMEVPVYISPSTHPTPACPQNVKKELKGVQQPFPSMEHRIGMAPRPWPSLSPIGSLCRDQWSLLKNSSTVFRICPASSPT